MSTHTVCTNLGLTISHEVGATNGNSRNAARDWVKWAFHHLWSCYAWDSSCICKGSSKYANGTTGFPEAEKNAVNQAKAIA